MAAFVPLFGAQLDGSEGQVETEATLAEKEAIGVFFASSDSEASKEFSVKLTEAYEALNAKGFEVVLVCMDETEEAFDACFADLPGCALPFASSAEKQALVEKFGVTDTPVLILVNKDGATIEANDGVRIDGVAKVTEDPTGEDFPWLDQSLSETEILTRMGSLPPEAGEDGLKGVFIRNGNFLDLGLLDKLERDESIHFSGHVPKPYAFINKAERQKEIQKMGVMSDWQPYAKDIEKFPYDELLLIFDPDRVYGEKFVMPIKGPAFDREKARVLERRQEVLDAHELTLVKNKERWWWWWRRRRRR